MKIYKYKVNFVLDSRIGQKEKSELTSRGISIKNIEDLKEKQKYYPQKNVQIFASITFLGKRELYYIGHRIDRKDWISEVDGEKIQKVKTRATNRDGITSAAINKKINNIIQWVDWFFEIDHKLAPTTQELRYYLRLKEGKIEPPKSLISVRDYFNIFIESKRNEVGAGRTKSYKNTLNHIKKFETQIKKGRLKQQYSIPIGIDEVDNYLLEDIRTYLKAHISHNTIIANLNRIRVFTNWCKQKGYIKNNPFSGFIIGKPVYGEPIALSQEERDFLASFEPECFRLKRTRDMFILHCHIGCRISDFINFTTDNVSNGYLSYIPTKTIGENDNAITIKLTQTANSIIEKYKSDENILFPFISKPKYNKYLKELCKAAGLTRSVQILQNKQPISKPLHETVSAHTARKTFINILYSNGVKNEIIASMSGHVEDSKAFFRYRKIDQDLKDKALASIE